MKVSAASSVDGNGLAARQVVLGRDYECQRVGVDHRGGQTLVGRIVADHAQFQVAVQQFVGDLARQAAPHPYADLGIQAPEVLDVAQQVQGGRFVGAHRKRARRNCRAAPPASFPSPGADFRSAAHSRARCGRRLSAPGPSQSGRSAFRPVPLQGAARPARRRAACAAVCPPRGRSFFPWPPPKTPEVYAIPCRDQHNKT